ncbi:hypothetical protein CERSUDRAFT_125481, partial [Gelatoporia subvermispora B]
MLSLLSKCSRCRHETLVAQLRTKAVFTRSRTGGNSAKNKRIKASRERATEQAKQASSGALYGPSSYKKNEAGGSQHSGRRSGGDDELLVLVRSGDVWSRLQRELRAWTKSPTVYKMLQSFGVPVRDLGALLSSYSKAMTSGDVQSRLQYTPEQLDRIAHDLSHALGSADQWLSKILFEWAAHEGTHAALEGKVAADTIAVMTELFRAADLAQPYRFYPRARIGRPRTVIMHVGPTNSGKTHNALRALAAAKTGVYGGPLRLLAAEIFERLNRGQIVPAGVDPNADAGAEPDTDSTVDVGDAREAGQVVIRKTGTERYARTCNMITGEEQKFMGDDVGLLSCTVEMTPLNRDYDVAVLDEIQLIADPDRGGAWTAAVLGLNARELHLCGEETAVPLIQAMLRDTGDRLIVNRYQRLTPLKVAETNLGDLTQLEKGDCIVTFSRKGILNIKKLVEKGTGMQCAVAYGRLPPEIRNEQAALFNDPENNYGILIGSDAIGLGLNLKIKRMIFESVRKFDGNKLSPLPVALIKQIAGRAGRFGLHSDDSGGVVTTFAEEDLDIVREALAAPMGEHKFARMNLSSEIFRAISTALPPNSPSATVLQVMHYVSRLHPRYSLFDMTQVKNIFEFIDVVAPDVPAADQILFTQAPTPWRDPYGVDIIGRMMLRYRTDLRVDLYASLQDSTLWNKFVEAEAIQRGDKPEPKSLADVLNILESVHKVVTFYLWTSYRKPLAFPHMKEGFDLKEKTERLMDWCLDRMTTGEGGLHRRTRDDRIQYKSGVDVRQDKLRSASATASEMSKNKAPSAVAAH